MLTVRLPEVRDGGRGAGARRALRGGVRRRPGGRGGQAGRARRAPGRGPRHRDPGRRAVGPLPRPGRSRGRRGLRARSAGDRAPARQGHLGAPGGGADGGGLPGPRGTAGHEDDGAPVPGAGGGRRGGGPGRGRGADRALHPHAHEDGGHRRREAGPHRLHGSSSDAASARRRCSSSRCRAGGPTRYASTWRPSATPWSGMPATGWPTGASAPVASSCTRYSSRFTHPGTGARMEFTSELPEDLTGYLG